MPTKAAFTCNACKPVSLPARALGLRGFTLIELIMVMVLLGILAAYAAPRLFTRNDFDVRGVHDQSMAYLRYAQKMAIAQRRQVCVAFTTNSMTLTIAAAAGTGACPGATALRGPDGEPSLVPRQGAVFSYAPLPATMAFDALGQPLSNTGAVLTAARTVTVSGSGRTITIEAATGYVHD